jgi:hypothetical protein
VVAPSQCSCRPEKLSRPFSVPHTAAPDRPHVPSVPHYVPLLGFRCQHSHFAPPGCPGHVLRVPPTHQHPKRARRAPSTSMRARGTRTAQSRHATRAWPLVSTPSHPPTLSILQPPGLQVCLARPPLTCITPSSALHYRVHPMSTAPLLSLVTQPNPITQPTRRPLGDPQAAAGRELLDATTLAPAASKAAAAVLVGPPKGAAIPTDKPAGSPAITFGLPGPFFTKLGVVVRRRGRKPPAWAQLPTSAAAGMLQLRRLRGRAAQWQA